MSWEHLRDQTPRAAKQHQCFLCGRGILVGERHVVRTGILDGGLDTFRMHSRCEAITSEWDDTDWECFSPVDRRPA